MTIYYLPITPRPWNHIDTMLLSYVSDERKSRISRFKFVPDQKLSLYAALLTRMAIIELTHMSNQDLHFSTNRNQKPYLISDHQLDFNFSHTRNAILCSISSHACVGTDIEAIQNAPLEVMPHVFHPFEIQYVTHSNALQDKRFFEIWTKKEAYTKNSGIGLTCDLVSINTMDSVMASHFYTWQEDSYICSVYASSPVSVHYQKITEPDIFNFFHVHI